LPDLEDATFPKPEHDATTYAAASGGSQRERGGAVAGGVVGALLLVVCLCGVVWWHQTKQGNGWQQRRPVISITNALFEATPAHASHHEGGDSISDGLNEGYRVVHVANADPNRSKSKSQMATLQSRADRTISFLVPMADDEHNPLSLLQRPLPRTPTEYIAAADGGAALYSVPFEGGQELYVGPVVSIGISAPPPLPPDTDDEGDENDPDVDYHDNVGVYSANGGVYVGVYGGGGRVNMYNDAETDYHDNTNLFGAVELYDENGPAQASLSIANSDA